MNETRIAIDIPDHPTSLLVGRGLASDLGATLARAGVPVVNRTVVLAFDTNVASLAGRVDATLQAAGARTTRVALSATEREKSMDAVARVWSAALSAKADRSAVVVALGGGLIGDLAGFAAATYLRG
ncbi:MAG: 3-dehydroquinate synthase, partial [Phycisphaerales bacterium]